MRQHYLRVRREVRTLQIVSDEPRIPWELVKPFDKSDPRKPIDDDFLSLMASARFVLTDSGGLQEETTYLGIPCLTMRPNTERPVTIREGTNELVTLETMPALVKTILGGRWKTGRVPALWDGATAGRIGSSEAEPGKPRLVQLPLAIHVAAIWYVPAGRPVNVHVAVRFQVVRLKCTSPW